ncbi:MAG: allophanate hydrolase [Alphaproteobacteria bacterium]|nr:allophanate hydrolase [Alphaproteobacteria bacterium]
MSGPKRSSRTAPFAATILAEARARIDAAGDPGIFIALADRAPELPEHDEHHTPLWGVPFAIKDNIDLAGTPTTAACPAYAYTPSESAPAVQRLIAAGAVPVGKTNMDQFATGLTGTRTPYPIPRNAVAPDFIPGGSSSGSAVAVARGLVPFALGTDTAGSGRVPAAMNGVVGLKPTKGAVSTRGVIPACRTLDTVSVFARSVGEAWTVYAAMAAFDPADPFARPIALGHPGATPPKVRIGVPASGQRVFHGDEAAAAAFEAHVCRLRTFAEVVEIDVSAFLRVGEMLYGGPWLAERVAAFGSFVARNPDAVHPMTRKVLEAASGLTAAATFEAMYTLADLRRRSEAVWPLVEALAMPTVPTAPTVAAVLADPIRRNAQLSIYTNFVNLLDLCALAVPGEPRHDGVPAGITFIAPAGRDAAIASLGMAFLGERTSGAVLPYGTVPLVVVGAHMSGLPLNNQLLDAGASFVAATKTAPLYRLYALPSGPPHRPGMVRVDPVRGAAIAVEVWAMPLAGFGAFVAGVPSPLSIGTVHLADGSTAQGFLAEGEATGAARDITALGGWRAYLAERP